MFLSEPLFLPESEQQLLREVDALREQLSSETGHRRLKRKMPVDVYQFVSSMILAEAETRSQLTELYLKRTSKLS
jgi:hypothetical protein